MVFHHTRALSAFVAVVWLLAAAHAAAASEVRLGWFPVAGSAGYVVYHRETGQPYGPGIDVGRIAPDADGIVRYIVGNVSLNVVQYFAVSSYDAGGIESGLSNELALKLPMVCATAPLIGCRVAMAPGASVLSIRNPGAPGRDRLGWKWKGDALEGDFGDPSGSTNYLLCIYDESGGVPGLATHIAIQAAGACSDGRPCWRSIGGHGFAYKNQSVANGTLEAKLKQGPRAAAAIQLSGTGASVTLPAPMAGSIFHQDPRVVAQLVNDSTPAVCWEAVFSAPARVDTSTRFKAVSD